MRPWKTWIPSVIWMGVIFVFSSDLFSASHTGSVIETVIHFLFRGFSDETVHSIHFGIRKACHVTAYFILGILYQRGQYKGKTLGRAWVVFLTFLYACTDEWHQSFSSVRTASWGDVGFDTFGGLLSQIRIRGE